MSANRNQVRTYSPQQLVNALSLYVNKEIRNDKSLKQFQTTGDFFLHQGFDDFCPLAFSRLVWSYATYGFKHSSLFNGVAEYIVANKQCLDEFEPGHLSVLVWSFAKADHGHRALFEVVATHICQLRSLERFSPQDLANIVWAFATNSYYHQFLFEEVAIHICQDRSLEDFDAQNLANIVWAFATNSYYHQLLFEEVATHVCQESQSLEDFDAQNLSTILWSYAKVDHVDTQLFNKVAIYICGLDSLDNFSLQSVSTVVWASAKVGCYNESLFVKIASYCVNDTKVLATEANEKNISMLIWAYATVETNHPELFETLTEHVLSLDNLDSFNSFALTNLIWGLNQFTTPPTELLYKVIDAAVNQDEARALVRISNSLFPGKKEICLEGLTNKCTGRECGKLHLDDDTKLLEVLVKRRWEKLLEEEEEEATEEEGDSPSEEDESPTEEIASLDIQDNSSLVDQQQQLQALQVMKDQVESYLEEKEKGREQMPSSNEIDASPDNDAEKAKATAKKNGVSEPKRKTDKKDPTEFDYTSELHYEIMRYTLILSLIESEFAEKVPLLTEQCVRVLLRVSPHDLHVIWFNHCATQYAGPKGHCNLHAGNGCREGYDMENCASVIAMIAIAEYFTQFTDIKFDDVVEHVQCVNLREFCLTNGSKFRRCAIGSEEETDPLVGIINLFLDALSQLKVFTIVASSAGRTCGIEELVLKKLKSPSRFIMICRRTLWHLQFCVVKHHAKSEQESAQIVTRLWEIFSSRFLTPCLESARRTVVKSIAEVLKDNDQLPFVSHDPTKLDDEIESSGSFLSKEENIDNLLKAMMNILEVDNDAQAEGQVHVVECYAQNHYAEIKVWLGNIAPTSWQYLSVRDLLINMGRNGQDARLEKYGHEEVLKQCSKGGEVSYNARVKKYGLEELLKQCSKAGEVGGVNSGATRKEKAEEKEQQLIRLAETGAPFWAKALKGDITAEVGQRVFRAWKGKMSQNFPRIQESHGQFKEVDNLCYKKCPHVKNVVVDYTYKTLSLTIKIKGYRVRVAYGMLGLSEKNGNAILCWYEKKK